MTKADLAAKIAVQTGNSVEQSTIFIESFMDQVKKSNSEGNTIFLRGFGSFGFKLRAKKIARNILKNEPVTVPAHKIPYFKPASEYKDLVKNL